MQEEVSFKKLMSQKASLISFNNSCFKSLVLLKLSTHLGNLIAILATGNSYNILEKILLISFIFKLLQFKGITLVLYLSDNLLNFYRMYRHLLHWWKRLLCRFYRLSG